MKAKKKLEQIMSLSLPFCKNEDEILAAYFRKINSLAHEAEIYVERYKASERKP